MNWFKKISNNNYYYIACCVDSNAEDIEYMVNNAVEVTFEEFITHVNNKEFRKIERDMGYPFNEYLKEMKDDYAVSF
jgi:hypothetical protein